METKTIINKLICSANMNTKICETTMPCISSDSKFVVNRNDFGQAEDGKRSTRECYDEDEQTRANAQSLSRWMFDSLS